MNKTSTTKTLWGKAKGTSVSALVLAIPIGVVIAAVGGWLTSTTQPFAALPVLGPVLFGAAIFFPAIALSYALIVDRTTIKDALDRPEDSVENQWYTRASSAAVTDLVAISGALLIILVFVDPVVVELIWVLVGVIVFAMVSVGTRYLIQKLRG